MNSGSVKAKARITLLSTEEGGRSTPLAGAGGPAYRPNHNFYGDANRVMAMGEVGLPDDRAILPGDTFESVIRFISSAELLDCICEGFEWKVQEGARVVGRGTILEILEKA